MKTALIQAKIEPELKNNAEKVLKSIGLDTPSAIRMFLTRVVKDQDLPFETHNKTTQKALADPNYIGPFQDVRKLFDQIYEEIGYERQP
jgi:DNA-damage-inducible protein J